MAPFVGLTGGLGAGKSEALRLLGELGAATLSTDAVVHELLEGDELRHALVARLGPEVAPGGRLDRARIAERVFVDDDARAWLEELLWPRVAQRTGSRPRGRRGGTPAVRIRHGGRLRQHDRRNRRRGRSGRARRGTRARGRGGA